jgi:hypothetical protein
MVRAALIEKLPQCLQAGPAVGAGATGVSNGLLSDTARGDRGTNLALIDTLAQTDDHVLKPSILKMIFNFRRSGNSNFLGQAS